MKVAVVPNLTKEAAQACTNEVLEILAGCGCETVLKTDLFTSHGTYQEKVEDSLLSCDVFIAIGGDGTIIHTANWLPPWGSQRWGSMRGNWGLLPAWNAMSLPCFPI